MSETVGKRRKEALDTLAAFLSKASEAHNDRWFPYGLELPFQSPLSFSYLCGLTQHEADRIMVEGGLCSEKGKFNQSSFSKFVNDYKLRRMGARKYKMPGTADQFYIRFGVWTQELSDEWKNHRLLPPAAPRTAEQVALQKLATELIKYDHEYIIKRKAMESKQRQKVMREKEAKEAERRTKLRDIGVQVSLVDLGDNKPPAVPPPATKAPGTPCEGIPSTRLQDRHHFASTEDRQLIAKSFDLRKGRWYHRDCTGEIPPKEKGKNCEKCKIARSSIRKDRMPSLFSDASSGPTSVTDLAPTDDNMLAILNNLATRFETPVSFEASDEAKQIAKVLHAFQRHSVAFTFPDGRKFLFMYCIACSTPLMVPVQLYRRGKLCCVECRRKKAEVVSLETRTAKAIERQEQKRKEVRNAKRREAYKKAKVTAGDSPGGAKETPGVKPAPAETSVTL